MTDLSVVARRRAAHARLVGHRWWAYRACAPSETMPRLSAADDQTPLTVWDSLDGETQPDRRAREAAAATLCAGCPLRSACLEYALGTPQDGPYERTGVWGGRTPAERRRLARKQLNATKPTPVAWGTAQGKAVLSALAAHTAPERVAAAAGVDVRTANWQRARLVTALRLDPRTATRMQVLTTAWHLGWLPQDMVLVPDGHTPLAAIPSMQHQVTAAITPPRPEPELAGQLALPLDEETRGSGAGTTRTGTTHTVRRRRHLRLVPTPPWEPLPLNLDASPFFPVVEPELAVAS